MDEFATGKTNVYNEEKKLTSEIVPSVFAKETFNEFSSFPGTVSFFNQISFIMPSLESNLQCQLINNKHLTDWKN